MSEINVTPLVDVMLVLLVIFMVTAPMMQQGIEVELPKTTSSGTSLQEDPVLMVIKATGAIQVSKVTIPLKELQEKLRGIFSVRKEKQIYIQADKDVKYQVVAEVMAEARAAGIYNISLITIPKD